MLVDLLYQALGGRLFWIPPSIRSDLGLFGVDRARVGTSDCVVQDSSKLLDFVDRLRWGKCPEVNRYISEAKAY